MDAALAPPPSATPTAQSPQELGKSADSQQAPIDLLLHLADCQLILAQRDAQWCGHGPLLEEDIAMANLALDLLGQARLLYQAAGERLGRTEDELAYFRDEHEFRNFTLCELPHSPKALSGNAASARCYAVTIVRHVLYGCFMQQRWEQLSRHADARLAAIADKALKETRYLLRHASDWLLRIGDGTADSHARGQRALDLLAPYVSEFWLQAPQLRAPWCAQVGALLAEATLHAPADLLDAGAPVRAAACAQGSLGRHSEHMGYLLAEMQSLARAHPGAKW